mmetsp:Transcript_10141/g.21452  ORF Transcript_10141/g.21452 Transcript_10141/m.21452 type:complete len:282 (-) Transcript_10141:440-1285(-)
MPGLPRLLRSLLPSARSVPLTTSSPCASAGEGRRPRLGLLLGACIGAFPTKAQELPQVGRHLGFSHGDLLFLGCKAVHPTVVVLLLRLDVVPDLCVLRQLVFQLRDLALLLCELGPRVVEAALRLDDLLPCAPDLLRAPLQLLLKLTVHLHKSLLMLLSLASVKALPLPLCVISGHELSLQREDALTASLYLGRWRPRLRAAAILSLSMVGSPMVGEEDRDQNMAHRENAFRWQQEGTTAAEPALPGVLHGQLHGKLLEGRASVLCPSDEVVGAEEHLQLL